MNSARPSATADTPKRQERGLKRMSAILDGAEELFGEVGFDAATTNAIAARSGISPGSLYQFFRNKEQIAEALAERYVVDLTAAQSAAVHPPPDGSGETLEEFVDRAVDNMVAFNAANPAFLQLFSRADTQPALYAAVVPLQNELAARVEQALAALAPALSTKRLRLHTLVALQIARGMMPVIAAEKKIARKKELVTELKTALIRYLTPVLRNV
ncbi:TetR/AcrR family transcriptional regulator [Rhodococcus sp. NPDC057297]|uniref:TetR/AcrR family transcriptional regulator n=1 Tax=Rhodococcus sp. NPDC057297 TaxID=3346090 RepID=UPI00363D3F6C